MISKCLTVLIILIIWLAFLGGYIGDIREDITGSAASAQTEEKYKELDSLREFVSSSDKLILGNFNIQVFGKAKSEKEKVMQVLEDTIESYDIISIQEIRDQSNTAFPSLVKRTSGYEYVVSERLGRTSSKEQYAYVYNPSKVELILSYVYDEPEDIFEREPFIAQFRAGNFSFVLIQIHTKPEDAEAEIANLEYVLEDAETKFEGENEFIILGDLNADCSYYNGGELSSLKWVVPDSADTTTGPSDCAYDRIIITEELSDNIVGYGTDRFDLNYNLSDEEAKAVSDHYPVFAVLEIK